MIKQFQLILIVTLAFNAIANAQTNNAYGDNQKEVEPGVFAIFSGDVNQDGVIDVLDQGMLDNDMFNFAFGYVVTDLNGDAVVDLLDQGFLDNNMFNFVGVISPLTGSRIASPQQGNRRNTINTIQNKN
jgi:hypothetical protein